MTAKTFSELELPESLQAALARLNFTQPTQIQAQALPILMEGSDLIACSQTGSGKTAAYAIPMVKALLEDKSRSALILVPTRELAQQVASFLEQLTSGGEYLHLVTLVGGMDIRKQFKKLQKRPRIIVATPGRLIDHLKRNTVQIHKTEFLVLDEGDCMIDMGFAPQLRQILEDLPEVRQTSLFTATLDEKVQKLASQYLRKPKRITIGTASKPAESIRQEVLQVQFKQKDESLLDVLNARQGSIIVFLRTKHRTDRLKRYLSGYGYSVDLIHGGRSQGQRNMALQNFRKGKTRILCATDVAARGLDVPQVEHVINFDLPMVDEDYVHRIGRTARNGAEGSALSFVTPEESSSWNRLVRKFKIADALLPEPQRKEKSQGRSGRPPQKGGRRKFSRKRR